MKTLDRTTFTVVAGIALMSTLPALAQTVKVNPLTGTPLELEQRQRRLEELKLETQMLEEQAKQAEIRVRLSGRPNTAMNGGYNAAIEPPVFPAPSQNATPLRRLTPRLKAPARAHAKGGSPATPATASVVPSTQVSAIFRSGDMRRAVVHLNGEIYTVGEGDAVAGQRITSITDAAVTIGAISYALERRAAFVSVTESDPSRSRSAAPLSVTNRENPAWPPEFKGPNALIPSELLPVTNGVR